MKKLFYASLCIGALSFTGCFAMSPSSPDKSIGSDKLVKDFCANHPEDGLCQDIAGKTELSPQEVKPVMKLMKDSLDKLYGASSPSLWIEGYYNLPATTNKSYDSYISYTYNFSVERGSALAADDSFNSWTFNVDAGATVRNSGRKISATEGGDSFGNLSYKGVMIVRVAVFSTLGKYFFLPPVRFAP